MPKKMDTAQMMFSAAAATASMDSWDLENLKYLRKISRTNNNNQMRATSSNRIEEDLEQSYCETASYLSSAPSNSLPTIPHLQQCCNSGDEIMSRIFEPRFKEGLELSTTCASVHKPISQSDNQFNPYSLDESSLIEGPEPEFCLDNEIKLENGRFLEEPNALLPRPLDTCCEFEILTIRNESVLASKREALVDPQNGSNEDEPATQLDYKVAQEEKSMNSVKSGSVNISIIEEFWEEGNFIRKDQQNGKELSQNKKTTGRSLSATSSCPSSSSAGSSIQSFQSTIIENERRTAICPFCDGVGERLSSTPGTAYYYLGENENGEVQAQSPQISRSKDEDHKGRKLSTRTTCEEEEDSAPPLPRTPSPYYVRLRRDLITSYAPALCPPRNFGMDKEGQLLIDYSQNWLGLEKYMHELKLA